MKGKYKWAINKVSIEEGICKVDILEPILIVDVVKEVMDYITKKYPNNIKSITIRKNDSINMELFKEDLEKLYEDYYDKYNLMIKNGCS